MRAFWKYDKFPFCLSGFITDTRPNGNVTVEGYRGCIFKPIAILPDDAGAELAEQLSRLQMEYETEVLALKKEYMKKSEMDNDSRFGCLAYGVIPKTIVDRLE